MVRSEAIVREVRAGDAELLAASMRRNDIEECLVQGREPLFTLERSLILSERAFAVELGGELAALGGVVPGPRSSIIGPTEYDVVWLLTGKAVDHHKGAFWRASMRVVAELRRIYPVLLAHVDARYAAALRWAARLGAEVCPTVEWGASKEPFHPIVWRS